jgi:Cys-rich repeat protein
VADGNCGAGRICAGGQCVPGCRADADCAEGQICEAGRCAAGCRADADCAAGQTCQAGQCTAAAVGACDQATAAALGDFMGTTAGLDADTAGTCGGAGPEAVYALRLDQDTLVCATTAGSAADTVVYVRAGDCASGEEVACDDDAALDRHSAVDFLAEAGTTYNVFVDSARSGGDYQLTLREGPCVPRPECQSDGTCGAGRVCVQQRCEAAVPAGTCAAPLRLAVGQAVQGSTAAAPALYGATCGGGAAGREAVYTFAPGAGAWCLDTAGSDFDTVLHVRTTCADPATERACDDDAPEINGTARDAALTLQTQARTGYLVFVDGHGGGTGGNYTLIARPGACPAGP